jgi:putative ABC transport system permease protein
VTGLGTLLKSEYGTHFKYIAMVRARIEERVVALGENKFTQSGYFMQPEGADILTLKMISGTREGLKDMKSILLSRTLAKKLFADTDAVNQVVTMDAKWDLKVTGVYEDLPKNSEFNQATYFAPLDLYLEGWSHLNIWNNYNMWLYVQIHPKADFEEVSAIIKDAMVPYVDEANKSAKPELFLHPMSRWHLHSKFENSVNVMSDNLKFVWLYSIIGVFVLFLACINFMNLSTARSEKRAKEIGIRKTIGSIRYHLILQFLCESLMVTIIAFGFSLWIVQLILPWFNEVAAKELTILWTNFWFWLACLAVALFTALLAGSYPALYLSSFNPINTMKATSRPGRYGVAPRKVLVIFQFAISIALIIGTMIVHQQIQYVKDRPVGYTQEGLLQLRPRSPEYKGKYHTLRNELKKTGVVYEMAESNYPVTNTLGWNPFFDWKGRDPNYNPSFNTIQVSHEYGKTIGLQFVVGRDFSREFSTDLSGLLLNESALNLMGLENPVGEIVTWNPPYTSGGNYHILGIVKDMVKGSPFGPTRPSIIFLSENDLNYLFIRIHPQLSVGEALPKIKAAFNKIIPSAPFDYNFVDDLYATKFQAEERIGKLADIFAILAILISCLGLFGLASFVAEQRTKEIGIRKVFGASVVNLWRMLSKDFMVLVIFSCFIAIPIAYYFLNGWLQNYEYRIGISWWILIEACMGAMFIAIFTVSFQAVKAALKNPVESLKYE